MTYPIIYSDAELRQMHSQIANIAKPIISRIAASSLSRADEDHHLRVMALNIAAAMVRSALFFKHKAYKNEDEYRFLQIHRTGPVADLKYRGGPYSLVRYIECDWKSKAAGSLKEIIIGPAADSRIASYVHDCVREFGPENIIIKQSDIPYRLP